MAKRSVKARVAQWGEAEFKRRMKEWGKLGGRPADGGKTKQAKTTKKGGK